MSNFKVEIPILTAAYLKIKIEDVLRDMEDGIITDFIASGGGAFRYQKYLVDMHPIKEIRELLRQLENFNAKVLNDAVKDVH